MRTTTMRRFTSFLPTSTTSLVYHTHGNPSKVLKLTHTPLPALSPHDILLKYHYSPINPADINQIQGVYPLKIQPQLPACAGNEGAALVIGLGSATTRFKLGDHVIPALPGSGTWTQYKVAPESQLLKIPDSVPWKLASALSVNPSTALRLLQQHVLPLLKSDSNVIVAQNGANSAVGMCLLQMCHYFGIKTVNLVRRRAPEAFLELEQSMKKAGADVVLPDDCSKQELEKAVASLGSSNSSSSSSSKVKIAFNCVGGDSCSKLIRVLDQGGTVVTYGGMSRKPVSVGTGSLIFGDVCLKGFWLSRWSQSASLEEKELFFEELCALAEKKVFDVNMETVELEEFQEALVKAEASFKDRKIVFKF